MILEEFDECKVSTFDPCANASKIKGFPKIGVTCFSRKLLESVVEGFPYEIIGYLSSANGRVPIYKINYKGVDIAFFMSLVGSAACVVGYEEITAMGLEKLIVFGTCGVLDKNIGDMAIIIPTSAIRDEGTSYHYMKSSEEVSVNEKYKEEFINVLKEFDCGYVEGKVWTTDAPYRETRTKVARRKEQGCVCVDMECSALAAVSKFRGKDLFQFFYAADNLDNVKWDKRSLDNESKLSDKERIVYLALELATKI